MRSFLKRAFTKALHPYLLGLFFILRQAVNVDLYVSLNEWLSSLLVVLIGIFILHIAVRNLPVSKRTAGFLTFVCVLLFLFYSDLFFALKSVFPDTVARHRFVIPILVLMGMVAVYAMISKVHNRKLLNSFLNTAMLIILATECGILVDTSLSSRKWKDIINLEDKTWVPISKKNANESNPDIYFIITDAYTSSSSLKNHWGFNNSLYTDSLTKLGFTVNPECRSKYTQTLYSLSSMLNMDYVPNFRSENISEINENTICRVKINSSKVIHYVLDKGYDIVNLSFFDLANLRPPSDFDQLMVHGFRFNRLLFKRTLPGRVITDLYYTTYDPDDTPAKLGLMLKQLKKPKGDKFIYTHLLSPHEPYFYDADANIYDDGKGKFPNDPKNSYLEQLKYTNNVVLKAVSEIRKDSPESIIIIQGDHGPGIFDNPEINAIERHNTFGAVFIPNSNYKNFADYSPVNLFALVFNDAFDESFVLK